MDPRTETKNRMLRSGALLFRQQGLSGTSFADVLEHSGAPRGSVYHHFPGGKEQFTAEATAYAGRFVAGAMRGMSGDLHGLADAQVDLWIALLHETDFAAGCPIAAAALEGTSMPGARDAAGSSFQDWIGIVGEQLVERGVPESDSRELAMVMLSAVEGALIMCRACRNTEALEAVREHLHDVLSLQTTTRPPRPPA
jgi:AcrR family transcriptional regulator